VWILRRNAAETIYYQREWQEEINRLGSLGEKEQAKQLLEEGKKLGYRLKSEEGSLVKLTVDEAVELRKSWNNDWKE
ncbi:hypothetical protein OFB79_26810, partial [Escherichia coli]|nr:hypothetical protein [Escherichia coli]